MKKSITLASALAFAASGAFAGGIAPAAVELEPMAPVVVEQGPSGSLAGFPGGGLGAAAAGVAGVAVLAALLSGSDDDDDDASGTTTTTTQ